MKIKIGKANWISNSDNRLDASYHLSEALETKRLMEFSPYKVAELKEVVNRIFLVLVLNGFMLIVQKLVIIT